MTDSINLTEIEVRDIGGIDYFKAALGTINVVVGENGEGKTSLLSAIRTVFEGGSDPDLVRRGAEFGEITLTFSNGYTASKRIAADGYDVKVRTPEGGIVRRPAEWLRELAPSLSFDPIAFLDSPAKDRAAFLLKHLPVAFDPEEVNGALGAPLVRDNLNLARLNELRDGKYDERSTLNRQVRDLEGTIANLRKSLPYDDATDWSAEANRLQDECSALGEKAAEARFSIERECAAEITEKRGELDREIQRLEAEFEQWQQAKYAAMNRRIADEVSEIEERKAALSLDLGTARAKAEERQRSEGVKQAIEQQKTTLAGHVSQEMALSKQIKLLDELKHRKLRELPIPGLDIRIEKGKPVILVDEIPLEKLNRQRQIFFAVQSVMKAAGRMPLMLVEAAELSDTYLGELEEAAKEAGLQLVLARWRNEAPLAVEAA